MCFILSSAERASLTAGEALPPLLAATGDIRHHHLKDALF